MRTRTGVGIVVLAYVLTSCAGSWARSVIRQGERFCRQKRVDGAFSTHVEEARCKAEQIRPVLEEEDYRDLDLVNSWLAEEITVARGIDEGMFSEEEGQLLLSALRLEFNSELKARQLARGRALPRGLLKEFSGAKAIVIYCGWEGYPGQVTTEYRFRLEGKDFPGTGSVSTVSHLGKEKQSEVFSSLIIPSDAAQAFFAALAQSPLREGEYRPFWGWTDDYPEIEIEIKLDSQTVRYFTRSQGKGHVPWRATISGVNYVIDSDEPARALATLDEYLHGLRDCYSMGPNIDPF